MPGIGAYNSMGGMSTMNFMYQNLAANRRQNNLNVETEGSEAVQSTMENESASAMRQPPPPPPPQDGMPQAGGMGRMTSPPPSEDEFPAQQFTEQEEEEVPLAATAAGIA